MSETVSIIRADEHNVHEAAGVFDLFRQHYGETSDYKTCVEFLVDRQKATESIVFFAKDHDGDVVGFTQLYPIFSSVPFRRDLFLGDLFVVETARGNGVGRRLLEAAKKYGNEVASKGILLTTDIENANAQELYKSFGFEPDTGNRYYYLTL
ncbi:GNAT family N-acetyltransferase [Kiloniella sp.]|uniref:GNAT family N-acetyltransferase n=1 Tax=Kiloniella sp. TaxID=1938587 RepID=UPI003B015D00